MAEPAHPIKCQGNWGDCPNPVARTSGSKCQLCLDKDSARKQEITLQELLENRELEQQRKAALIAKGLARPPPPAGYHFCHGCQGDLPDAQFNLSISTSRCIRHHTMAAEAKKALAEKKKIAHTITPWAAEAKADGRLGRMSQQEFLDSTAQQLLVHSPEVSQELLAPLTCVVSVSTPTFAHNI